MHGVTRRSLWYLALPLALIGVLCLTPGTGAGGGIRLCLLCGDEEATASALLNVLLYVPLGVVARAVLGRSWPVVLLGAILSAGVETAQMVIPGRFTALADVVANTTGAGLGAWIATHGLRLVDPPQPARRRLALAAGALAASVLGATGFALAPAAPAGTLYTGWTPALGMLATYDGALLDATAHGRPLRPGPQPDADALREALLAPSAFRLHVLVGPPPPRLAAVFHIVSGEREEAMFVGIDGHDLLVRVRYRADAVRLDRPTMRLPGALADHAPGDRIEVAIARIGADLRVRVDQTTQGVLDLSVASGWSLLFHPRALGPVARSTVDALWLALLFFPVGWLGRARDVPGALLPAAAVLAVVAVAHPSYAPDAPVLLVGAAGTVIGWAAARRFRTATDPEHAGRRSSRTLSPSRSS